MGVLGPGHSAHRAAATRGANQFRDGDSRFKAVSADQNHRVRMLWLSGVLHAFTHLYQLALIPLYLLIQKDFHLASEGEATLLVSVMGIAYFLPSYPMGILADRFSRKKLLALGLAINGLGFVGLALAPNYALALVCVTLAGFGGSFYHPAATALVARLYPVKTGRALGLVAIGASIGFCLSPIYTGWRAEMAQSWRAPVLELGMLGILFAGIFYKLAGEEQPLAAREKRTSSQHTSQKMFPTATLWFFFLASAIFFSLRDFAGSGMASLGSLFLQQAHGLNPKTTGFILSGIYIASAVSNPLFGRLSDGGRIRWAVFLLGASFVTVLIFPHLPKRWLFLTLMTYGFFFLASYPVTEAMLMESVPDAVRGRVFGLFITLAGFLGNLSHWMVGAVVQKLGPRAEEIPAYYSLYSWLAVMVLLSLLGLPCFHAIRRREGLEPHVTQAVTDSAIPNPQSAIK